MTELSNLEYALMYASLGWHVLPVHSIKNGKCTCCNPNCNSAGKHPITKHGHKDATSNKEQINEWWTLYPYANVGIRTGKESGIIVLDIDPRNGGNESLDDLEDKYGKLPDTVESLTGGGGRHKIYQSPGFDIKCSSGFLGKGLDIKADGGFIVAPPSKHVSGKPYEWKLSSMPDQVALVEIPDWLLDQICSVPSTSSSKTMTKVTGKIPEGSRNNTLVSLAGTMRRRGLSENSIYAALTKENELKCDPALTDNEVQAIAKSISRYDPQIQVLPIVPEKRKTEAPMVSDIVYHGLTGDIANTVAPYTEADTFAVLINFLTAFGNCLGPSPFFQIDHTKHKLRLFVSLVGSSAFGRKGTSFSIPKHILFSVDPEWVEKRITGGLSSGEGLIYEVRDQVTKTETKKKAGVTYKEEVIVDEGVNDKRLLVLEEEFAQALKVMSREGNILSPIIRKSWDDGMLKTMTKNSQNQATGAHISIIAHITKEELLKLLSETEQANGFGNRFLWFPVKRSKLISNPVPVPDNSLISLISQTSTCINFGRKTTVMYRSNEAEEYWDSLYKNQLNEERQGLLGILTARGPVQVMRLACLYAILDQSDQVEVYHLKAAMGIWDYNVESIKYIFGESLGDAYADRILTELQELYPEGLTETDIWGLFKRHGGGRVTNAINRLERAGFIAYQKIDTGGRPAKKWFYANKAKEAKKGT